MKNKKDFREIHHHHYTNWHKLVTSFFVFLLCTLFIIHICSEGISKLSENKIIHQNCVSGCKYMGYEGIKYGVDWKDDNCYVKEYDRTECIKDCNKMLLELKK